MLIANAVLSRDCELAGNREGATRFAHEVERLSRGGAATWTRDILSRLTEKNRTRVARREIS